MSSARALFREAKAAKLGAASAAAAATPRVRHPLAAYDAAGRLRCTACALPVKSATAWPVHLASQAHKNAVRQAATPASAASAAVKRKADVLDDAAPVAQQQTKKPAAASRLVSYAGSDDDDDDDDDDAVPPRPPHAASGPAAPQRDTSSSTPNGGLNDDDNDDSAALPTGFFDADMTDAAPPSPDADPAADEPDSTLPAGFFDAAADAPAPSPPPPVVVDDDPMADDAPMPDASAPTPATGGALPAGFFADTQPANLDAEYAAFEAELAQDASTTDPVVEREDEEDLDAMFRRIQAERDADEQQTLEAMQARVRALAEHRPRVMVDATAVPEVAAREEEMEDGEESSDVDSDEEVDNWRARRI
ncbi:hypothetical protein GGF32_008176 [Allomyces javanicus]|nr:hypothetical protein GGF32_008176 [Allomyces javanicus]